MYVCIYVRMYVCIYVRMYVCIYVCMYVCIYVRMYVCMHVCMYVCMHICTHVCMHTEFRPVTYFAPQQNFAITLCAVQSIGNQNSSVVTVTELRS